MKKITYLLVVVVLLAGLVLSCAKAPAPAPAPTPAPTPAPAPAPTKPIELSLVGVWFPNQRWMQLMTKYLIEPINERFKGRLSIKYLGGPDVIPPMELGTAVQRGTVDMVHCWGPVVESMVPEINFYLLIQQSKTQYRETGLYDFLVKLHEPAGIRYLVPDPVSDHPEFNYFISNKKVKTPYELAGLSSASLSTFFKPCSEALGMSFMLWAPGDQYTSLQSGLVDVAVETYYVSAEMGLQEVAHYPIEPSLFMDNTCMLMNLKKWQSIPKDWQNELVDTFFKLFPDYIAGQREYFDWGKQTFLANPKNEVIKFSPADEKWYIDTQTKALRDFAMSRCPKNGAKMLEFAEMPYAPKYK